MSIFRKQHMRQASMAGQGDAMTGEFDPAVDENGNAAQYDTEDFGETGEDIIDEEQAPRQTEEIVPAPARRGPMFPPKPMAQPIDSNGYIRPAAQTSTSFQGTNPPAPATQQRRRGEINDDNRKIQLTAKIDRQLHGRLRYMSFKTGKTQTAVLEDLIRKYCPEVP